MNRLIKASFAAVLTVASLYSSFIDTAHAGYICSESYNTCKDLAYQTYKENCPFSSQTSCDTHYNMALWGCGDLHCEYCVEYPTYTPESGEISCPCVGAGTC